MGKDDRRFRFDDWRALHALGAPASAILAYTALRTYMNPKTYTAWPTYERLNDDTGLSIPTLRRAIKGLENMGSLRARRRQRGKEWCFPDLKTAAHWASPWGNPECSLVSTQEPDPDCSPVSTQNTNPGCSKVSTQNGPGCSPARMRVLSSENLSANQRESHIRNESPKSPLREVRPEKGYTRISPDPDRHRAESKAKREGHERSLREAGIPPSSEPSGKPGNPDPAGETPLDMLVARLRHASVEPLATIIERHAVLTVDSGVLMIYARTPDAYQHLDAQLKKPKARAWLSRAVSEMFGKEFVWDIQQQGKVETDG